MPISIANDTKNIALENAFKISNVYILVPNFGGSPEDLWQEASFGNAVNGTISLAAPVMFAVQAGTTINRIDISSSSGGTIPPNSWIARIQLEGDEIIEFDSPNVFLIESITIEML